MNSIAHPSWCDPTECSTRPDGQLVHRSVGEAFDLNTTRIWTASMLTVQLVETGEGIEVGVKIEGAVVTSIAATLFPETAIELGQALLDHGRRALGSEVPAADSHDPAPDRTGPEGVS